MRHSWISWRPCRWHLRCCPCPKYVSNLSGCYRFYTEPMCKSLWSKFRTPCAESALFTTAILMIKMNYLRHLCVALTFLVFCTSFYPSSRRKHIRPCNAMRFWIVFVFLTLLKSLSRLYWTTRDINGALWQILYKQIIQWVKARRIVKSPEILSTSRPLNKKLYVKRFNLEFSLPSEKKHYPLDTRS